MIRSFRRTAVPVASAASFTAISYPAKISAVQSQSTSFTIGGTKFVCTTNTQTGELTASSETLELVPTYAGCNLFGISTVTITGFSSSGCAWRYRANGSIDLACKSGDVQMDAGPCTMTIEPSTNQNRTSLTYTNNTPSVGKFVADVNVTNLHVVVTTAAFGCPIAKGTYLNASMGGTLVFEGKTPEGVPRAVDVG
jgi:hypothetical protein